MQSARGVHRKPLRGLCVNEVDLVGVMPAEEGLGIHLTICFRLHLVAIILHYVVYPWIHSLVSAI